MRKTVLVLAALGLCLSSRLFSAGEGGGREVFVLADFEGQAVPVNGDGDTYPYQYAAAGKGEVRLDPDAPQGVDAGAPQGAHSVALVLEEGKAYPQFNPFNFAGGREGATVGRGFAREYGLAGQQWKFSTYNRFSFWVRNPVTAAPLRRDGRANIEFGTYVKTIKDADAHSDETGGNHYYHFLNIAPTGTWTRVILNMHPNHQRSGPGNHEWGNLVHPTGESEFNYWDTFTRFYFEYLHEPRSYPAVFKYDAFEFYREPYAENDEQVYSIAATYVPKDNRVILTWFRNKKDDMVKHEVRYGFADIHESGWASATPAPDGIVTPPSDNGYNGMVYETTALPLEGRDVLFLAIKPENSDLFSRVSIPVNRHRKGEALDAE